MSIERRPVRAGLILNPETWSGGRSYFRNLLIAVQALRDPSMRFVVFASTDDRVAAPSDSDATVVRTRLMNRRSLPWFLRKLTAKFVGNDWLMQSVLARHADVIFSLAGPFVARSALGCVGWIPDFQHVHLPAFFTPAERTARDREFLRLCQSCDKLIVSSDCALADLKAFAPAFADKASVVHFVASPGLQPDVPGREELERRYEFTGDYFLLPNQFWVHKNHRLVIDALRLLKSWGQPGLVIATGGTHDPRQPAFFDSLMAHAREQGVLDRFRVLGSIPFADVAGLMKHTVAFINPSLFEGWSTSVEESKSMGKRVLLSDIPVHREQAPELGRYFGSQDAEALAGSMRDTLQEFDEKTDAARQEHAREALPARQRHFALEFQGVLRAALAP